MFVEMKGSTISLSGSKEIVAGRIQPGVHTEDYLICPHGFPVCFFKFGSELYLLHLLFSELKSNFESFANTDH